VSKLIVRGAIIGCLGLTTAASAIELPDEILFCRTVADAVERAECYDRAVDALKRPSEVPETVATTPPPPPTPIPPAGPESLPDAVATRAAPSEPPAEVEAPEPVEGPIADTRVSTHQASELEQQVADLEQQVALLEQGATDQPSEPVSSEDLFGKDESATRNVIKKIFGLGDIEQIQATVAEVKRTPYGKLVIVLDNGQIWTQLDSSRLTVRSGDGVLIKSARLGSFLLEKQTGSRSIRVKRVD
jgi:hypothetical protein